MSYYCEYKVEPNCMENAGLVSSDLKKKLKALNVDKKLIRKIIIASYEAEINIVIHSDGGKVLVCVDNNIVDLVFEDVGPGIDDINLALQEGFSTASKHARDNGFGAGLGLPNIKAVADEFDIKSSSEGTRLQVKFYINESE